VREGVMEIVVAIVALGLVVGAWGTYLVWKSLDWGS